MLFVEVHGKDEDDGGSQGADGQEIQSSSDSEGVEFWIEEEE